ncbi:hypothetical protein STCU_06690 [Strigomonas culicis]|uniref:Uncharacterized protein n=1 Tax=Strigomonas culicis TaxID=28005 RepID=S9VAP2_9TRYP|nr:hypothetical protein STCU_09159 [Strigomonas culicis]EPY25553.1 hypothetical protein STCU_06690 [Strigomonas culicis]|eukprot:EPY20095.1 hypothetical protein STCU_09159 [Strigomonas culicis]
MKERELWELSTEAIQAYFTSQAGTPLTAEEAANEVIACCPAATEEEEVFVRECTVGVGRFEKLLEGLFHGYCEHLKRNTADRISLYLMAYILVFRYDELGFVKARQLFNKATIAPKIAEYVAYLVDIPALRESAFPFLKSFYGEEFLQKCVVAPLESVREEVSSGIVEWFRSKGTGTVAVQDTLHDADDMGESPTLRKEIQTNYARPHPKPRLPPAEVREMAATRPEKRPPPVRTKPGEVTGVLVKAKKPVTEPIGFTFHERDGANPNRSKQDDLARDVLPSTTATLKRRPSHTVRKILNSDVSVRTTNATLRREAFLNQKNREEEEAHLTDKEFCLRDSATFDKWRDEQKELEREEEKIAVMERHLDAIERQENMSRVKAEEQAKRQRTIKKTREKEAVEGKKRAAANRKQQEKQKGFVQNFRSEMVKGRIEAVVKSTAEKNQSAEDIKRESERLRQQAKEEEEHRKTEQALLIEEIRRLRIRLREQKLEVAEANRTGGSTDGDLAYLTVAELQRELEEVRAKHKDAEEAKRQAILAEKNLEKEKRDQLERECIAAREKRTQEREAARQAHHEKAELIQAARTTSENARMLELCNKLEEKRRQKRGELKHNKERERQNQYELLLRSKDVSILEQERWKQQEQGITNRVSANQARLIYE